MSIPIIKLIEHKTSSSEDEVEFPNEDYKNNAKLLSTLGIKSKEDQRLKQILYDEQILTIKELKTGLEISPSRYIGSVQFSEFIIKVFPKYTMSDDHIHLLLDYVWELKPKIKFLDGTVDVEKKDDALLIDIVISSLIVQCKAILKRGLLKTYVVHEENIPFLRGKLLLKHQIHNTIKNNVRFFCQFDELEHDNIENKIILAALHQSHNITKDDELKRDLRILMHQFSMFVTRSHITVHDFDRISYNRLNQNYELAHDLSRLILESTGFKEFNNQKKLKIRPFFIDMDDVFEKFIEKLLRFYYTRSSIYDIKSQKTKKSWTSENYNDHNIRTDILIANRSDKTKQFIIDTKYKKHLTAEDRYQIAFYIHEYEQNEATAILPKFVDTTDDKLVSEQQGIKINVIRIDINEILNSIEHKSEEELLQIIDKWIRQDMRLVP